MRMKGEKQILENPFVPQPPGVGSASLPPGVKVKPSVPPLSINPCAGYLSHPLGKEAYEEGDGCSLSYCVVCRDQERGEGNSETEPEEQAERQGPVLATQDTCSHKRCLKGKA
jgi:hypothetical protein